MSAHEHITHIGNTANNWRMTREEAIRRIESKQEPLLARSTAPQARKCISASCTRRWLQSPVCVDSHGRGMEGQPSRARRMQQRLRVDFFYLNSGLCRGRRLAVPRSRDPISPFGLFRRHRYYSLS